MANRGHQLPGVVAVPAETTDFIKGAFHACLLALACWGIIGAIACTLALP